MFDNLAVLLDEAGLDARHVLRTTLYLTSYDDFAEVNAIYRERLPEPYPARTTLQVAGLPLGARVQIDAVADAAMPWSSGAAPRVRDADVTVGPEPLL